MVQLVSSRIFEWSIVLGSEVGLDVERECASPRLLRQLRAELARWE
jgi:hypothetical protein